MNPLSIASGSSRVRVRSSDARVLRAVETMFPEYVVETRVSANGTSPDEVSIEPDGSDRFRLRSNLPSPEHLGQESALGWAALSWAELMERLEHVLADYLLAGHPERLHLHAGGANLDGVGLLVLGESGSGKSTVSVCLARHGASLLGDDIVLLRPDGIVEPFHRRPKLDAAAARRLGIAPSSTVLWDPDADECWLDPREWAGWSGPVSVGLVVCVGYRQNRALEVERLSPAQALSELLGSLFPSRGVARDLLPEGLVELAAHCIAFRVNYGKVEDAITAIHEVRAGLPTAHTEAAV